MPYASNKYGREAQTISYNTSASRDTGNAGKISTGLILGALVLAVIGFMSSHRSAQTPPNSAVASDPIESPVQSRPLRANNILQPPIGVELNGTAAVITMNAINRSTGVPYMDNNHPMHNLIVQNNTNIEWRNVRITINPGVLSFSSTCENIKPGQQALIELPEFTTSNGNRLDDNLIKIMRVHINADTPQGAGSGDLRILDYIAPNAPEPPGVIHQSTPPLIWTNPINNHDDTYKVQQEQPKTQYNPDGSIRLDTPQ